MKHNIPILEFTFLLIIIILSLILSGCSDNSDNTTKATISNTKQSHQPYQYATPPIFVAHPDSGKLEYPNITLYYDDGKYIFTYNPKTQVRKQLTSGVGARLAHQKDKFAHSFYKYEPEFASSSKQQGFYVYTLETGEERFLTEFDEDEPMGIEKWSNDDKYIVLDSGTYVERGKTIIDTYTGKIVTKFATLEDSYDWLTSDEIIFVDLQPGINRPYAGSAHGIATFNLVTKKKKILKNATDTDNYSFIKIRDDGRILFSKTIYKPIKTGENLERDDPKTSYWVMDIDGNNAEEINNYIPPQYDQENDLSTTVKKILPEPYNRYNNIYAYPLIDNWVIIYGNNRYRYAEFFIMDKTNPSSLSKFGEGSSIDW